MIKNFSLNDLFIRILPGGALLGVLILVYHSELEVYILPKLESLYIFIFFTFSYLLGEILQTIAHSLDKLSMIFFKFYLPSEIFLYKNNPVLKDHVDISKLIEILDLDSDDQEIIKNVDYKEMCFFSKRKKFIVPNKISQRCFWKLYTKISNEVDDFNRGYLLIRALFFPVFFISVVFLINKLYFLFFIFFVVSLIFIWRLRGTARMLVFKTVNKNLYTK